LKTTGVVALSEKRSGIGVLLHSKFWTMYQSVEYMRLVLNVSLL